MSLECQKWFARPAMQCDLDSIKNATPTQRTLERLAPTLNRNRSGHLLRQRHWTFSHSALPGRTARSAGGDRSAGSSGQWTEKASALPIDRRAQQRRTSSGISKIFKPRPVSFATAEKPSFKSLKFVNRDDEVRISKFTNLVCSKSFVKLHQSTLFIATSH